jgi:hypothetical protein
MQNCGWEDTEIQESGLWANNERGEHVPGLKCHRDHNEASLKPKIAGVYRKGREGNTIMNLNHEMTCTCFAFFWGNFDTLVSEYFFISVKSPEGGSEFQSFRVRDRKFIDWTLKLWNYENLKLWNSETLKLWNTNSGDCKFIDRPWNSETLKLWNSETLKTLKLKLWNLWTNIWKLTSETLITAMKRRSFRLRVLKMISLILRIRRYSNFQLQSFKTEIIRSEELYKITIWSN